VTGDEAARLLALLRHTDPAMRAQGVELCRSLPPPLPPHLHLYAQAIALAAWLGAFQRTGQPPALQLTAAQLHRLPLLLPESGPHYYWTVAGHTYGGGVATLSILLYRVPRYPPEWDHRVTLRADGGPVQWTIEAPPTGSPSSLPA